MLHDLRSIKTMRMNLEMSQKNLAKECGISGSMLNQIEKGNAKPSYETAKKIFEYLEKKQNSIQKKAGEICHRPLFTLKMTDTIDDAIRDMRKHGFSQIPIFDSSKCKGLVTERGITALLDNPKYERSTKLSKIKESVPPIVSADFPANPLKNIINVSKCILVEEKDAEVEYKKRLKEKEYLESQEGWKQRIKEEFENEVVSPKSNQKIHSIAE